MGIRDRLVHAYNAFTRRDSEDNIQPNWGGFATYGVGRPERNRLTGSNERSLINSIYTRLGIDVAAIDIQHVRLDKNRRFTETIDSGLNQCLNVEANLDQAASAFKQDMATTLFDKGVIAIVAVDTSVDPKESASYEVNSLRVGYIVNWMPQAVRVNVYNERNGKREEIVLPKKLVAIVENPLYAVMNETNSTLQRLIRKLNLLDAIDNQTGSNKLDLIIQLPYTVKTEVKRQEAEKRRSDIERQLSSSDYGIAYTDGVEKITQLNRPVENNLLKQIEWLTGLVYNQLGLTESVFNGTASEAEMLNYYNRTVEPVVRAVTEELRRTFLTKTARSQGQSILYFRDPFKLTPVEKLAEIADKMTRNEIMSSNEFRGVMGLRPSTDPKADELRNSNMPIADTGVPITVEQIPFADQVVPALPPLP